jgi:hypothetical protein
MSRRTETDVPTSASLTAVTLTADHVLGTPPRAAPTSTLESDMHLVPEQLARNHMQHRHREAEAWRVRRVALAVRKAEAAERRARLAREAAVLAAREAALATV